ncbi:AAA family ATPase [bacterium]|nr:AAA family ATPase [bacterium]
MENFATEGGVHERSDAKAEQIFENALPFVGREEEFRELRSSFENLLLGKAEFLSIEANSGFGKSTLLSSFLTSLECPILSVFGQEVHSSAASPLHSLSSIVSQVLKHSQEDVGLEKQLQSLAPEKQEILVRAFPQLAELYDSVAPIRTSSHIGNGSESFGDIRTLHALQEFLVCLGSAKKPAFVIIDDAQWSCRLTLEFLQRVSHAAHQKNRKQYVSFITLFRSDEVTAGHSLRGLSYHRQLKLSPLSEGETHRFLSSSLGEFEESVASFVHRMSAGNPFMVVSILRGLIESEVLLRDEGTWRIEASPEIDSEDDTEELDFIRLRFSHLPSDMIEYLQVAAVIGKEFSVAEVQDVSGSDSCRNKEILQEVERRHILQQTSVDLYQFTHDKLRETVLEMLPAEQLKSIHRKIAFALEHADGDSFSVAYHYDRAGTPELAFFHALSAAEEARKRYALEIAERYYRIALAGSDTAESQLQSKVLEGLGDVAMLQGFYTKAEGFLRDARDRAEGEFSVACIQEKLGQLAFKRGDMARAVQEYSLGLANLGVSVPRSRVVLIFQLVLQASLQGVHLILPWFFLERYRRELSAEERLRCELFNRISIAFHFDRSKPWAFWSHFHALNTLEQYGPTPELASALSGHAAGCSLLRWFSRGIRYAERSLALRRALHDQWGEGVTLHFYGVLLYTGSRYSQAIDRCTEAVTILKRTGDRWEANMAELNVAYALYRLGEMRDAAQIAQRILCEAEEIGDNQCVAVSASLLSKASGGKVEHPIIERHLENKENYDLQSRCELAQFEGISALARGDTESAIRLLRDMRRETDRRAMNHEYTIPCLAWLLTAYRVHLKEVSKYSRWRLFPRLLVLSVQGILTGVLWRNNLAHVLREVGMVARSYSLPTLGWMFLHWSLRAARRQRCRAEEASTRWQLSSRAPANSAEREKSEELFRQCYGEGWREKVSAFL